MDTITRVSAPSTEEWMACRDLPQAGSLFNRWCLSEIDWSRRKLAPSAPEEHQDYVRDLNRSREATFAAVRIWEDEQAALRERIAARIEAEIPHAADCGVARAVRENDWSVMQP